MRKKGRTAIALAGIMAVMNMCPGLAADGRAMVRVMAAEHDPVSQGYLEVDFEDDYQPFEVRSGNPSQVITVGDDANHVLLISGREFYWDGWHVDVTDWMVPRREYTFTAWIKQTDKKTQEVEFGFEMNMVNGGKEWQGVKGDVVLPPGVWKQVKFNFTAPSREYKDAKFYIQSGSDETFDFMSDEISIRPAEGASHFTASMNTYSPKETYKDDFRVGTTFTLDDFQNEGFRRMMQYQFNSGTWLNELKPDYILDRLATIDSPDESPELKYDRIDTIMTMARDNGIPIRGNALVANAQMPQWFFKIGYDENDYDVDSETLDWRMEQYIRKVLTYTQSKYPGVIYAWDVVNEAADDAGGCHKDSSWYRIMGDSFVEKAFTYARKYADPQVKLYYNDRNAYLPAKRDTIYDWAANLKDKGLIDGIGMQGHLDLKNTDASDFLKAAELYGSIGLEVQVTELDIDNPDNGIAGNMKLADKYAAILAGVGCGIYESVEAACDALISEKSSTGPDARNVRIYDGYHKLYQKLYRSWRSFRRQMPLPTVYTVRFRSRSDSATDTIKS